MNKFVKGQRVFWADPDDNKCSGWGTVSTVQPGLIGIAKDDGGYVDADPCEVSEAERKWVACPPDPYALMLALAHTR